MLAQDSFSTKVIYNHISEKYTISKIIIEEKPSIYDFFSKRIKIFGINKVLGQISFFVFNFLKKISNSRIKFLIEKYKFITTEIPSSKIFKVKTVNSKVAVKKNFRILSRYNCSKWN